MNQLLAALSEQAAEPQSLHQLICQHLCQLLTTRQGSLAHYPDYGLPDIVTFYQGFPDAKSEFIYQVKLAIERFEPRLMQVWVSERETVRHDSVLHLSIKAVCPLNTPVEINGIFLTGGGCLVN